MPITTINLNICAFNTKVNNILTYAHLLLERQIIGLKPSGDSIFYAACPFVSKVAFRVTKVISILVDTTFETFDRFTTMSTLYFNSACDWAGRMFLLILVLASLTTKVHSAVNAARESFNLFSALRTLYFGFGFPFSRFIENLLLTGMCTSLGASLMPTMVISGLIFLATNGACSSLYGGKGALMAVIHVCANARAKFRTFQWSAWAIERLVFLSTLFTNLCSSQHTSSLLKKVYPTDLSHFCCLGRMVADGAHGIKKMACNHPA